jgi:xanthine dehydrogenase small subunit
MPQHKKIVFICNDKEVVTEIHPAITVLDFLRQNLSLTGTKEGCREGDCGACTVLVGELIHDKVQYKSANSCLLPLEAVNGKHVVTIEGLNSDGLTPIQNFMVEEGGTQCGFCTPGFIVSMSGYFLTNEKYDPAGAVSALDGNICRCTGHASIKRAAVRSVNFVNEHAGQSLVESNIVPSYFAEIQSRLNDLKTKIETNGAVAESSPIRISGGTDLYVQKWTDLYKSDVSFLHNNEPGELIYIKGEECIVNSSSTVSDIMNSVVMVKLFPDIKKYFSLFGSLPIRNRATIGGNIVNASPIADMTNFFLALNAKVNILAGSSNHRVVLLKDFFLSYKTLDLKPGELIRSLSFPLPTEDSFFSYEKVSRRTYLDIASVNSSMYIETKDGTISEVHISAGGVGPIPLYLAITRDHLLNKKIDSRLIAEAVQIALTEISPITDARGSADYKRLLLRQLIFAHFLKLFPGLVKYEELV